MTACHTVSHKDIAHARRLCRTHRGLVEEGTRVGVRLTFRDEGPGIPDIKLAMTDGWTSGSGLGLGLTGAKRLVDDFELESTVGVGTRITITRWT